MIDETWKVEIKKNRVKLLVSDLTRHGGRQKWFYSKKTMGFSKLLANANILWYAFANDESTSEDTKVSVIINTAAFHLPSVIITKQADQIKQNQIPERSGFLCNAGLPGISCGCCRLVDVKPAVKLNPYNFQAGTFLKLKEAPHERDQAT